MMPEAKPTLLRHSSFTGRVERRGRSSLEHQQSQQIGDEIPVQPMEIEPSLEDAGAMLLGGKAAPFKGAGSYRILYICVSAAAFVNAMTFSVLGPFLPDYVSSRFGSSSTQVGLIMAAYPAVNLVTSPLIGSLINRYGRLNVLFSGLVTLAAATALYGAATSVFWLFVASGLHGLSLSFIHVSSLALLSAYPDRITEGMGGIEVWSGVALVLGPPLGGLAYPLGGVSFVFLLMAMFPLTMLLFARRIRHLMRSAKDDIGDTGPITPVSVWKVARNRGVMAGALVTAYNYGIIGFLEATLSPHLARTLSTSPSSIGFVFILPNVLYTVMAAKAEEVVDRIGVKRSLFWGLAIMGASLLLFGPSPALAPVLVSRGAVRGTIGFGLLAFQVGSALATVPAFTVMQAGVASMGRGGCNAVASVHALSIGVGEVIGPVVGGMMLEMLPRSRVMACEPGTMSLDFFDPIKLQTGVATTTPWPDGMQQTETQKKVAGDGGQGNSKAMTPATDPNENGVALLSEKGEEDSRYLVTESETPLVVSGDVSGARKAARTGEDGHEEAVGVENDARQKEQNYQSRRHGREEEDGHREMDLASLLAAEWNAKELDNRKHSRVEGLEQSTSNTESNVAGGNQPSETVTPAFAILEEELDQKGTRKTDGGRQDHVGGDGSGGGGGEEDGDESALSCESAFPLATTLVAWASAFGIFAMYRFYPHGKDNHGDGRAGDGGVDTV